MKKQVKRQSVWQGPCDTGDNGGITFSMLSRFLNCRERFRIAYVEGLRPNDRFNHRIEYGQLWHTCEEALAAGTDWKLPLKMYCLGLCDKYPTDKEQIDKWYNVCKVQFPLYVTYWQKHKDVLHRTPLLQEQVFAVPYTLPSGRVVILRGKWDSVDVIGAGRARTTAIYLQENKTKSEVNEEQLKRQLTFDLQTMMYVVALEVHRSMECAASQAAWAWPIRGVRYNVIRRPLSGGKGSIVQHKPSKSNPSGESKADYYARLSDVIKDDAPSYFHRWKVEVSAGDVTKFRNECLDPILEQLCDWWHWQVCGEAPSFTERRKPHWRHPFGVYNILDEGGSSDLDEYLSSGSEAGLCRVTELFTELKGG